MDNQEKFQETQDEAVSREAREDRDAYVRAYTYEIGAGVTGVTSPTSILR